MWNQQNKLASTSEHPQEMHNSTRFSAVFLRWKNLSLQEHSMTTSVTTEIRPVFIGNWETFVHKKCRTMWDFAIFLHLLQAILEMFTKSTLFNVY